MDNNDNPVAQKDLKLFWTCFIALVTTSFGFILRAVTLPQWGEEFNLTNTQIGEIAGVGLWPFAISIVVFSLIIDRIGYKKAMIIGFVCHCVSAVLTFFATGYWSLYLATFLVAIGNGTVEAVVNPVVATMFPREKTKWLNILHAGWPGGLVLGGVLAITMGVETSWKLKMILILLPTIAYGIMTLSRKFPANERVIAGIPYMDMLREVGLGGALIVITLIVFQISSIINLHFITSLLIIGCILGVFGYFVRSLGQPVFILLVLVMIPLAITELGTDSWISELMSPEMVSLGLQSGWILVYTSLIMMLLRLFAGSIVHRISPLTLLAISSAIAGLGLLLFSVSYGSMILLSATLFAIGKTFFWPTMLGVVSERFPKGGALTINITGGVGMMAAGVLGVVILGYVQDTSIDNKLRKIDPALHEMYATEYKPSLFGEYQSVDAQEIAKAPADHKEKVAQIQNLAKKEALRIVALFPAAMLMIYIGLGIYFKRNGGYSIVTLQPARQQDIQVHK